MAKYFKDNNDMKLIPTYDRFTRSKIRGNTVDCTLTLNPTVIGEQDSLYAKIPKLEVGSCIIPSSLKLSCKLKNKILNPGFSTTSLLRFRETSRSDLEK